MSIAATVSNTARSVIPIELQIRGAHLYDKTRRLVTRTDGRVMFTETPIPTVDEVDLADIDLSNPFLYRQGRWTSYFERVRNEAPVHFQPTSPFGPFWSVTRHADIIAVDKNHAVFSAEPFIVIGEPPRFMDVAMFIAQDPPQHDTQRAAVQGVVAPKNLREMEGLIRSRVREVLDDLPVNEPFDWVRTVSMELTARMLATLLDFPYEQRHKLVEWSDLATAMEQTNGGQSDNDEVFRAMGGAATSLSELWHRKAARTAAGEEPGFDLISLLQANDDTKDLIERPLEFLGNLLLLIVGGNDTTRNSMSGGVLALNKFPDQFEKLKADPALIPGMVSEIIRWQTPLAYMRRIAKSDTILNGQFIRKGDKVVMWYASGNRDERVFERPDDFVIDRKNARNHIAFGFGVHRCMGNRLAEMQLRILWEELLTRFENIAVIGEPEYVQSNFVRGITKMMVTLTPKAQPE
ncbi:putative cytochrome P450 [Rhodococcus sp. AW25M09]|uniref:cytochrome P450 n=1 Tax=Rhodococcus sp. AW25M09 TaxID=1268303 RepID=UPI0002AC28A0|nr:cytochrome P450 [Rhodococcus sp. AW25M09]CCQ13998.1 putative cytochrome P450 [Rhodococcus sp. AW25M09]